MPLTPDIPRHKKSFVTQEDVKPYIRYLESHLALPAPNPDSECAFCAIADLLHRLVEERDALEAKLKGKPVSFNRHMPNVPSHCRNPTYPDKCSHCSGVWHSHATQWPLPLEVTHTYHHEHHCPFYALVQDEEGDDISQSSLLSD